MSAADIANLGEDEVRKIAHLARLQIEEPYISSYVEHLSNILELVSQLNATDTTGVVPMAHPLNIAQRLRLDEVSETNQRQHFQSCAPAVEQGLYLVPKVIE